MTENWQKVHWEALATVNRDMGIRYFRRCGIPGSIKMQDMNKEEEENHLEELSYKLDTFIHSEDTSVDDE